MNPSCYQGKRVSQFSTVFNNYFVYRRNDELKRFVARTSQRFLRKNQLQVGENDLSASIVEEVERRKDIKQE